MSCALGADLSQGDDFCSFTFLFPLANGDFGVKTRNYISENTLMKLPAAMRLKYEEFMKEGTLIIMPGTILDMMDIYDDLDQFIMNAGYDVVCFGYDPYNAKTVINALSQWVFDQGYDPKQIVIPVSQKFGNYSPAVKQFDYYVKRSVDDGAGHRIPAPLVHLSDNPLWPYCFGCVKLQESADGMGNLKPIKRDESAACKVDPVQMLLSTLLLYNAAESQINK